MRRSPFQHPGARRLFLMLGQVEDSFCTVDGRLLHADAFLHEHLRAAGYTVIAFVGHAGVYFLDEDSEIDFLKLGQEPPSPRPAQSRGLASGPGGLTLSGPRPSDKRPARPECTGIRRGLQASPELAQLLRTRFRAKGSPRTAVVFNGEAVHGLQSETELLAFLRGVLQWDLNGGPAESGSAIIFRFPYPSLLELSARLRRLGIMQWLIGGADGGSATGRAHVVALPPPGRDEIEALVDRARLVHGLDIDWAARERLLMSLAAHAATSSLRLLDVAAWLRTLDRLDEAAVRDFTGNGIGQTAEQRLRGLVGLDGLKAHVAERRAALASLPAAEPESPSSNHVERMAPSDPPRHRENLHVVLSGNPGTGKTTVAACLGELYRDMRALPCGHVVKVTRKDLVGAYVGQTALKTEAAVRKALGGVLFIDEAYDLVRDDRDDFGQEAVNTLVELMTDQEGRFAVVAAGYPADMERFLDANAGLRSRFGTHLTLPDYDARQLEAIFDKRRREHPTNLTVDPDLAARLPRLFKSLYGSRDGAFANGRTAVHLLDAMARSALARGATCLGTQDVPAEHARHLEESDTAQDGVLGRLGELVGLDSVKETVRDVFARLEVEQRRSGGVPAPGHYVFTGAPGTGKTTVADLMGEQFWQLGLLERRDVHRCSAGDLIRGYIGQTEVATREFLRKGLGGVIFIDEAHQLAGDGVDGRGYGPRAVGVLVPFAEEHRGRCSIVLAGYPDEMQRLMQLDPGLTERFPRRIDFPNYSGTEMAEIFRRMADARGLRLAPALDERLAEHFERVAHGLGSAFANARTARNAIEKCLDRQARRLLDHRDATADELTLLQPQDLVPERPMLAATPSFAAAAGVMS